MKQFVSLLLAMAVCAGPLVAESTWEGTTTVSRYGEFPDSGKYAASNSFGLNTVVKVKNLENGNETTVIIVDRLPDPGLFMLVSRDAAKELGIAQGVISRVQATITRPEGVISTFPDDLPYNPDPDVNPAAGVDAYAGTETIAVEEIPVEERETQDTTKAEDTTAEDATTDATLSDETTSVEVVEVVEAVEAVEAVEDTTPKINGVDVATPPPEEKAPELAADEPTPPLDRNGAAAVSELESAGTAEEDRLAVGKPDEPAVEPDSAPVVLGLLPAPVLDQAETFVLLAEPDVPDTSKLVDEALEDEPLHISSLAEPARRLEERLEPVVPPEPIFEERLVETEEPVAEDILIVSGLLTPEERAEGIADLPDIRDEPVAPVRAEDPLMVSELASADATSDEPGLHEELDAPEIVEVVRDEIKYGVSVIDDPVQPSDIDRDISSLAVSDEPAVEEGIVSLVDAVRADDEMNGTLSEIELDEPPYLVVEETPGEAEDVLIVSELAPAPDTDDPEARIALARADEPEIVELGELDERDDAPVVVNGFAPPMGDSGEIELVLEPAEPRPPEPRIVQADLLHTPEGEEPEKEVEVVSRAEPTIEPETGRVEDTRIAVAEPDYITELSRESYYLQLGVFAEPGGARRLQDDLAEIYPVAVYLTESAERPIYKVLVGPLNQDESGALLYTFRTRGFTDAFVRKGKVN